jgi:hypothetical protein
MRNQNSISCENRKSSRSLDIEAYLRAAEARDLIVKPSWEAYLAVEKKAKDTYLKVKMPLNQEYVDASVNLWKKRDDSIKQAR